MEIDPDQILRVEFATVRRGYDPLEVQRYLMQVGAELRDAREQAMLLESDLDAALAEARDQARRADEMDVARLSGMLGDETAKVIEAAHEAAEEIRERAREDGELEREAGRQRAREMVAEARVLGESMLGELVRRRRALRTQIEQLQVARERLLEALGLAQRAIADVTDEIDVALPEAREAALRLGEVLTIDGGDTDTLVRELAELRRLAGFTELGPELDPDAGSVVEPDAAPVSEASTGPRGDLRPPRLSTGVPDSPAAPDGPAAPGVEERRGHGDAEPDTAFAPDAGDEQTLPEGDAGMVALRDRASRSLERNMARRLKRELSDELNTILGALRDDEVVSPVELMGGRDAQIERLREAIVPSLTAAVLAGCDFVAAVSSGEVADEDPSGLIDDSATALATRVVDQIRAGVERCGQGAGPDLAEQIRGVFRDWRGPRVDLPASRAVIASFNKAVIERSPEGVGVRWIRCGASSACEPIVGAGRVDDRCRCAAVPDASRDLMSQLIS